MKIVLSDTELNENVFPSDVQVIRVNLKNIEKYDNNSNVVAIIGSRAMAEKSAKINLPAMRLFQLTSAGYDGVPITEYKKRGVAVANAGAVYNAPIAETVVLAVLLMAKKLHKNPNNRHIKLLRHYDTTITEIVGKRVLVLGTGNLGTAIASRLQAFEAIVDGYNRSAKAKPEFNRVFSGKQELADRIGEYEYIISTLPESNETRGFINQDLIDRMSKNAVIVNVGRKAVFQEAVLYQALKRQQIKGAVLDMFEKVPNPITNKFRRLGNVIVLPGVSAVSAEVKGRLRAHIEKNILALINGDAVSNVINEA